MWNRCPRPPSFTASDRTTVGRRMFQGDTQLVTQLAALLERYRTDGILGSDVEPLPAATVLYGVCFTWMTAHLMNALISAEIVRNAIRRGTAIAMHGFFPRAQPISTITGDAGSLLRLSTTLPTTSWEFWKRAK